MKKKIAVGIICAVVAWVVIGVIDFTMVNSYHKPVFCVGAELADDGGSGTYVGLGYSFDIEGNFMPEAENPGVTAYRGYIFGIEVIRGFRDEMLPGVDNESLGATEEIEVVPNDTVLTEPPALTVVCGDKTVEALRGTTSWMYQNEDGTDTSIESDSMHPLQAKEYMTPLELIPTTISSIDPLIAYLQWDTIPDKVVVRCWSEEHWGQPTAESEEIPVSTLMIDSNIETTPIISVELKDGNYIYEVVAEWNSAEKYSGTAYYSFYTIKPTMRLQPIG